MKEAPFDFELVDITQLSLKQRFWAAQDLVAARNNNQQLDREYPYDAEDYRHAYRAFWRLGQLASRKLEPNASHYIIANTEVDETIGLASTRRNMPWPRDPLVADNGGIEMRYWHRDYDTETAIRLGITIMKSLFWVEY